MTEPTNVVEGNFKPELVPPPARPFESVPANILLYLHDALISGDKVFVPTRFQTDAGIEFCAELKTALEYEAIFQDIDFETATRIELVTHDLLPR